MPTTTYSGRRRERKIKNTGFSIDRSTIYGIIHANTNTSSMPFSLEENTNHNKTTRGKHQMDRQKLEV
jgi:hypothetical protein